MFNTKSEEKFFEHCTNCAIIPRPLSRDHFCENLASLLFHSSAGERLQFNEVNLLLTECRKRVFILELDCHQKEIYVSMGLGN